MKQKLVSILLVLCMVVALVPAIALTSAAANGVALPDGAAAYDGTPSESLSGAGTEDSPFIIANTADFMYFYNTLAATATAGQVFKMTGDVYWNAKDSTKYSVSSKNFAGILDGNGHTVYNAFYSAWGSQTVFGTVTGTIKNLIFEGTTLTANNGGIGGLCLSVSGGLIDNVQLKNAAIGGLNIGGVAGSIAGGATISNCSVEGKLFYAGGNDKGSIGGIVGSIAAGESGTIENCVNRADMSGAKILSFGGIVARSSTDNNPVEALTIKNCANYGNISAERADACVGGILGRAYRFRALTIENSANHGTITTTGSTATGGTGGILGYVNWSKSNDGVATSINGCQNTGDIVSAGDNVGGMVGDYTDVKLGMSIANSANYGNITGANNVGGIIGRNNCTYTQQEIKITNSAVYGNITATATNAGLIAGNHNVAYASGDLSATNCVLTGTVTAPVGAGGLVGYIGCVRAAGGSVAVNIADSFVSVTVKAPEGANAAAVVSNVQSNVTGVTLTTTNSSVSVTVVIGETTVTTPSTYFIYIDGALTAQTVELPAMEANALTNKTAVAKLNAYATENSLAEWAQGASAPELTRFYVAPEVPEITIDGASLTIGGNVTMNLFVKKTTVVAAGVTLGKISIVDNDNTPYEVTDDSGDYYVFTIKGLHASEFGKNKIYHVQYTTADAPGTPIDCTATKEYSPLQYAINMYNADDKTETVTDLDKLLLSIVNYADAAAKTTVASTAFKAAHADADFSMLPTFEAIIAEDTGVYDYDEKRKDDQHLPSISANLTETIALTLTFDGSDLYQTGNDNMMMIGNAEIPGKVNTLSVVFSELFATDLYNTITFTFVETYESGLVVTATTSLVQFLKSYQGTTEEALAAATAQYLYVARLFCLNNQPNA